MNGSSRSLIKALNIVVDDWKDNADENTINSDSNELFKVISLFYEKHSNLQSMKHSININDELFRIYNGYIKPVSILPREILFLEILTQLLPILIDDEIILWIKTYLKPAVDSAGFDIPIVMKSRDFICQLSMKVISSEDPLLIERRDQIASIVMDNIIQLYIGQKDEQYEVIGLHVPKEDNDTQLYYERIRYMKKNCEDLLHEYGLKKTKAYFNLINRYFKSSAERLDMLTLLSRLVATHTLEVYQIVDTDLFHNLFRSLLYDYDECILLVSLSLLVMLIPQVCSNITKFFPDLLVIYIRLSNWEVFNEHIPNKTYYLSKLLDEDFKPWDFAQNEPLNCTSPTNSTPTNSKVELDVLYLITLLYGLFPLNLSKFCQSPFKFLMNRPTEIFKIKLLSSIMEDKGSTQERNLESNIIDITTNFLRSFSFHPNFLQYDKLLLQKELENPLLWLFNEKNDSDLPSEEISLECLSFNPNLVIKVFNNQEFIRSSTDKASLETNINANSNDQSGFVYAGTGKSNAGSLSNSRHVSRKSSFASPIYLSLKDISSQKHHLPNSLQQLTSKLSNHIIDSKDNSISDIKFKDVKFNGGLMKKNEMNESENEYNSYGNDIGPDNGVDIDGDSRESKQHDEFKSNQLLSDMFSAHEKLYVLSSKASDPNVDSNIPTRDQSKNSSNPLNDKLKNELLQRPMTSPSTSLDTTSVHRGSISGTISNVPTSDSTQIQDYSNTNSKFQHGTALDYYHRELLLMKNELEFSNYMRDLNKTHYIKLKLKLNKLSRQACLPNQSIEHKNNTLKIDSLKLGYNSLTDSLEELKLRLVESRTKFKNENSVLFNKIKDLENDNYNLKADLKHATTEQQLLDSTLNHTLNGVLPERDFEVNRLNTKVSELERVGESLDQEIRHLTEIDALKEKRHTHDIQTSSAFNLSEQDKQIYNLKNDVLMLNDKNLKISQELIKVQDLYDAAIKSYESKLSSSKGDLSKSINIFTSQYERRIQELSAIILKYEGLLDEKNYRIAQFSISKPIEITNTKFNGAIKPTNDIKSYDMAIPQTTQNSSSNISQEFYEQGSRGRETPTSADGIYSTQLDHAQNYSNPHFPHQAIATPIVRGRGGIQKRSKKHM